MLIVALAATLSNSQADLSKPIATADLVFEEVGGLVAVEAEHFYKQELTDTRAWYITTADEAPVFEPDGDPAHVGGASGGAYLEILPDSRRDHSEQLIHGTNFSNQPGKLAILSYKIHFNQAGRYYVWVRAYSTGSEDNGIHVGLNGEWPETGQRMQWCEGKNTWRWESKQRTEAVHCGEPYLIYLDIERPGVNEVHFSMREDGFEFDKFVLTNQREFARPEDKGPAPRVKGGTVPDAFPDTAVKAFARSFPEHWGEAPQIQTMDYRPLPGGYGFGSSTMFAWIQKNLDADAAQEPKVVMKAADFPTDGNDYYVDREKWLAIKPDQAKQARSMSPFTGPTGNYHIVLHAVGESDGGARYNVFVNDSRIGSFTCPLSTEMFEEGPKFNETFANVAVGAGDVIDVQSFVASADGLEYSRARWGQLVFVPADAATRAAVAAMPKTPKTVAKAVPAESGAGLVQPRRPDGDGSVAISGELKQWHKVTLTVDGPFAHERDTSPNPFTDYNMTVTFRHASGSPLYSVPGYFAADGDAAESSAESGTKWRAHLSPDKTGEWTYIVSFTQGKNAAIGEADEVNVLGDYSGTRGSFKIDSNDKRGRDLRAKGRLQYVGERYLRFAGSGDYFLKAGADAPETFLAYTDFDNTEARKKNVPLKTWSAHEQDWNSGDPTWKNGKGKGMIGAINYLADKGCNVFSFLPYNAGGDGDNVWPFVDRDEKFHYDCSKLDQWGIVFDHATKLGHYLHFKLQETEIDDKVPTSLDGGALGPERKLYCREIVARFGHALALNWNLGEENTQTTKDIRDMAQYIASLDPYDHLIVIHTYPNQQDQVYRPLLGGNSVLSGFSLQNSGIRDTHWQVVKWVDASEQAGKPWVVAFDESGTAAHAQVPDLGYEGFDGHDNDGKKIHTQHEVRKYTLWGTLMGGGAGCEYYFGYKVPQNDLVCEDWRSRDQSWDYCRIALEFFDNHEIPFQEMKNANTLIGNAKNSNDKYAFAKDGELYLVYLPDGGTSTLDLSDASGRFDVRWFNTREGGRLERGSVRSVRGGGLVDLGEAPGDKDQDWLVVIR